MSEKANDIHRKDKPLKRPKPQEGFTKAAEKWVWNTGLANTTWLDVFNKNDRKIHTEIKEVINNGWMVFDNIIIITHMYSAS